MGGRKAVDENISTVILVTKVERTFFKHRDINVKHLAKDAELRR